MARYDVLYKYAFSLTDNPLEVEHLLQDCYVFFVTANTHAQIEDLDAYLRRMLSNLLRSNRMRQARYPDAEIHPAHQTEAARLSHRNPCKNRMLSKNRFNSAETERIRWQIVAHAYTRLWDLFWLPIRLIAKVCWHFKLLPKKWAPWLFGSTLGRYPEQVHDEHYTLCTESDCETCRSLAPGELDIDDEREIKHDPFRILSTLKHSQ